MIEVLKSFTQQHLLHLQLLNKNRFYTQVSPALITPIRIFRRTGIQLIENSAGIRILNLSEEGFTW